MSDTEFMDVTSGQKYVNKEIFKRLVTVEKKVEKLEDKHHRFELKGIKRDHALLESFTERIEESNSKMVSPINATLSKMDERVTALERKEADNALAMRKERNKTIKAVILSVIATSVANRIISIILAIFNA